ncbi:hypothetical protein PTKIN_Ptkin14bG0043000 [Pterospermum kingtungense]
MINPSLGNHHPVILLLDFITFLIEKISSFLQSGMIIYIPAKSIVWYAYANGDDPVTDRDSKVELINTGHLVLKDPRGMELWRSERLTDSDSHVSHAAMLNTGNFVIASKNSGNIWESFKFPTDTILPGQQLEAANDDHLLSALAEKSLSRGKYRLRFNDGFLILNQVDLFAGKPYNDYFSFETGSRLIFNKSGYIQILNSVGSLLNLAPENAVPRPESNYYRATLSFDGVLTLCSYPRNPSDGENWFVLWFGPKDICYNFIDFTATLGTGPCGYNSICEAIYNGRPNCTCPPDFLSWMRIIHIRAVSKTTQATLYIATQMDPQLRRIALNSSQCRLLVPPPPYPFLVDSMSGSKMM